MKKKLAVILDTNIIVKLDELHISPFKVKEKFNLFTTNAQKSEILNDSNEERKKSRLRYYDGLNAKKLQIESGIWIDKLTWDDSQNWNDESGEIFESIAGESKKQNTLVDALIAETSIFNNYTLVTDETRNINRVKSLQGKVLSFSEFLEILND